MTKKKRKGSNSQIGEEPFDDQLLIRCWSTDKKTWKESAGEESTSAWLRKVANEAAAKDIKRKK